MSVLAALVAFLALVRLFGFADLIAKHWFLALLLLLLVWILIGAIFR